MAGNSFETPSRQTCTVLSDFLRRHTLLQGVLIPTNVEAYPSKRILDESFFSAEQRKRAFALVRKEEDIREWRERKKILMAHAVETLDISCSCLSW